MGGLALTGYYYDAVAFVGTDPRVLDMMMRSGMTPAPGHSILFAGWMEHGVLSAVVLVAVLGVVLRQLLHVVNYDNRFAPLYISYGTIFVWHFFFSPFGTFARFAIGLFMALYVTKLCVRRFDQSHRSDHDYSLEGASGSGRGEILMIVALSCGSLSKYEDSFRHIW